MNMNMMLLDTDSLDDKGPWFSQLTTDSNADNFDRSNVPFDPQVVIAGGQSPSGGIDYIDQAVGGYQGFRSDAAMAAKSGILSWAQRFQPFNGAFIGTTLVTGQRVQGPVGQSNAQNVTAARARAAQATNIPSDAAVAAAFTNPALNTLLKKLRGK